MGKSAKDNAKQVSKNNEDVMCLNCFSVEDLKEPEPVTLTKIRKEHREKLKLYSFIASEISKPKVVPFKQRVSEPYAIGKKLDEKITKDPRFKKDLPQGEKNHSAIENDKRLNSDPISLTRTSPKVVQADGTVKQNDGQIQDISYDQISLAESVNENTLIDQKIPAVSSSSITKEKCATAQYNEVLDQRVLSSDVLITKRSDSGPITYKDTSREIQELNKTKRDSNDFVDGKTSLKKEVKKNIAEDAYMPKSLLQATAEIKEPHSSDNNYESEKPVDKKKSKLGGEKVKNSSKLFKLFTKSKSNKGSKQLDTVNTSTDTSVSNCDFQFVDEPYNELSVDEKNNKLPKNQNFLASSKNIMYSDQIEDTSINKPNVVHIPDTIKPENDNVKNNIVNDTNSFHAVGNAPQLQVEYSHDHVIPSTNTKLSFSSSNETTDVTNDNDRPCYSENIGQRLSRNDINNDDSTTYDKISNEGYMENVLSYLGIDTPNRTQKTSTGLQNSSTAKSENFPSSMNQLGSIKNNVSIHTDLSLYNVGESCNRYDNYSYHVDYDPEISIKNTSCSNNCKNTNLEYSSYSPVDPQNSQCQISSGKKTNETTKEKTDNTFTNLPKEITSDDKLETSIKTCKQKENIINNTLEKNNVLSVEGRKDYKNVVRLRDTLTDEENSKIPGSYSPQPHEQQYISKDSNYNTLQKQCHDTDKSILGSPNSKHNNVIITSTPLPLYEHNTMSYYNLNSGSIPEEPDEFNYDEKILSPSVHKCYSKEIREVAKNMTVTDNVNGIIYSKLDSPITVTPRSTKNIIEEKGNEFDIVSSKVHKNMNISAAKDINYKDITPATEMAKHELPDIPECAENVTMLYKIQIETPSSQISVVEDHKKKVIPCNIIVSPAKNKNVAEELHTPETQYHSLESKEDDKTDIASSNGSDSGYTGSSHHLEIVKTPTPPESLTASPEPTESKISPLSSKSFGNSMPVLNITSELHKNLSAYSSDSLKDDRSLDAKSNDKKLRWSTLSICKKPYDIDDEVFSESLSPGHATLPRRSNSPLPHDRDLDRDRFPINRSGLQARSESMASVYSGAGEGTRANVTVKGDVQFSLLYNYRLGALEVGVKRCRDLAAVDVKRNRSDPYVKVYLLPDKSKAGKRKTKVKKNTLNPVFEENLSFVQPLGSLSSRTLWLSVWHADMFGRNDFLGEVTLPLADVVFDDPAPQWHKLHERTEQFDEHPGSRGDLIVGLKFELQERAARGTLHVLVKEAKNLHATKPNGLADVFCKSYLLPERGRLAKQKTTVARRTLNPRWEHTFTYRGLSLQELGARALELSLWDRDRLASNDFMGAIRLSLGTGTYMGASVNWMDSVGKELTLWQTMMQRPNFWVEGSLPLRPHLHN